MLFKKLSNENLYESVLENQLLTYSDCTLELKYKEGYAPIFYYSDGSGDPGQPDDIRVVGTIDFVMQDCEEVEKLEQILGRPVKTKDLQEIGQEFINSKMEFCEFKRIFMTKNLELLLIKMISLLELLTTTQMKLMMTFN